MSNDSKALGANSENEKVTTAGAEETTETGAEDLTPEQELEKATAEYKVVLKKGVRNDRKNDLEWIKQTIADKKAEDAKPKEDKKPVETTAVATKKGALVLKRNVIHKGIELKEGTDLSDIDEGDKEILKKYC